MDSFNHLFSMGFDYEFYKNRSDRQKPRMELAWETAEEEASKLPQELVDRLNVKLKVLLIGENWCGDCANGVPAMASLANRFDNWEFSIVGKDDLEDQSILEQYATAGRIKIPVIIFADEDGDEITRWVERPKRSYKLLYKIQEERLPKEEYIAKYKSTPELKTDSVVRETIRELVELAEYSAVLLRILPKKKR